METFKQMFNQMGRTAKCQFISENIDLAHASSIAKYIKAYLFDVLTDVDDEYIATYLRNKGYVVTASSNAVKAIEELVKNADAWNKEDGFVPDFSDENKLIWFPWFTYDTSTEAFVSEGASASATLAAFGSRICFSTYDRAAQFGSQFIGLWNDFLLFRK